MENNSIQNTDQIFNEHFFFEWAENYFGSESGRLNKVVSKSEAKADFLASGNLPEISTQRFTRYCEKYAWYYGYDLNLDKYLNNNGRIVIDINGKRQEGIVICTERFMERQGDYLDSIKVCEVFPKSQIFVGTDRLERDLKIKSIAEDKRTVWISGKHDFFKNKYAFQEVNEETELIVIEDVPALRMRDLLSFLLPDQITVERKHQRTTRFRRPHTIITCDVASYAKQGMSSSERRRFEVVEFPAVKSGKLISIQDVREHCKCCICEEPLKGDQHINFVPLNLVAKWDFPSWRNANTGSEDLAVAFICDNCTQKEQPQFPGNVKYAIEFQVNETAIYHQVINLDPAKGGIAHD